jgi:peptidoglycan hydrolase-like protein with peptidoglycan-binding domain
MELTMEQPFKFEAESFKINREVLNDTWDLNPEFFEEEWQGEINRNNPEFVKWVQDSLNKVMGLRLAVDGIIGPMTRSAIRSFQQKKGLAVDGIAGPQTETALKAALAALQTTPPYTTPPLLTPPSGQIAQQTIYGWSQYRRRVEELPADQQAILKGIGDTIIASYKPGGQPVRTVKIYGHADWDTPRNPQREQQMSDERAQMIANWLRDYIGSSIAAQLVWNIRGFGATQLQAQPTSEANRRQNRRVKIFINAPPGPLPSCSSLSEGNTEFVRWLQSSLNRLLRTHLPVTGSISAVDLNALGVFQQRAGLPVSAAIDGRLLKALSNAGAEDPPCNVSAKPQPKLCFWQIKLNNNEQTNTFQSCADSHAKRICAIGSPVDFAMNIQNCLFPSPYFNPIVGAAPYRNGQDIVQSIYCAYVALKKPVNGG